MNRLCVNLRFLFLFCIFGYLDIYESLHNAFIYIIRSIYPGVPLWSDCWLRSYVMNCNAFVESLMKKIHWNKHLFYLEVPLWKDCMSLIFWPCILILLEAAIWNCVIVESVLWNRFIETNASFICYDNIYDKCESSSFHF